MERCVAVSKSLHSWLRTTVGIPDKKLVLIPNGVDTDRFSPRMNRDLRKELKIEDEEFVVGAVGRLDPIKNHEGLIDAVTAINSGSGKVRLVIVGDGPARSKLETILGRSSCVPRPLLTGFRSDVENVYAAFDVVALNSFAEGMSNTLLEAMASGLPVVCTSVGGNVELVEDGHRGRLIPAGDSRALADAFNAYMRSPQMRASHATNARRFVVEHFSLRSMVDRYVDLYESVA
jgi:glycosyltransferase involved in cell wall biosynthesis